MWTKNNATTKGETTTGEKKKQGEDENTLLAASELPTLLKMTIKMHGLNAQRNQGKEEEEKLKKKKKKGGHGHGEILHLDKN